MTTLRTAAQQALIEIANARDYIWLLDEGGTGVSEEEMLKNIAKIITTLKAALEQAEQEPIPFSGADEKPPVFKRRWRIAKDGFGLQLDDGGPYVHIDDALSVLHAALEQPEQEPVACPHRDEPRGCYRVRCQLGRKCVEPLYTRPPRREWRGLDRDETMHLMNDTAENYWADEAHIQRFARAVEAALRSKNT